MTLSSSNSIAATWRKTFAPLADSSLRLFFLGLAISLIGTWLQSTAQALLVFQLSGGRSEPVAITSCCTALPLIAFGPLLGGLTSHFSRRFLVITTQLVELILAAILGLLVHQHIATLTHVYLMAFLLGCAESVYFPAVQRLLHEIAGSAQIRAVVGLNAVISNIARFAGPMLAGLLISSFGVAPAFFLNSLSFVAVIVSLALIRVESGEQKKAADRWSLLASLRHLSNDARLLAVFAGVALMNVFGQSCYALVPALEIGSARATGLLLGSAGLGSLTSALSVMPFFQEFRRPGRLISFSLLWMGFFLALAASFHSLWPQLLCMWCLGLSTTVLFVTTLGLVQTVSPLPAHGALLGLFSALFYGSQPIAALGLAFIADRSSSSHTIQGSALTEVCGGAFLLLLPQWRSWVLSGETVEVRQ